MDKALKQVVLERLANKSNGVDKGLGGKTTFRHAVEAAWKAMKNDNVDAFEKALDAAVRIKLADQE